MLPSSGPSPRTVGSRSAIGSRRSGRPLPSALRRRSGEPGEVFSSRVQRSALALGGVEDPCGIDLPLEAAEESAAGCLGQCATVVHRMKAEGADAPARRSVRCGPRWCDRRGLDRMRTACGLTVFNGERQCELPGHRALSPSTSRRPHAVSVIRAPSGSGPPYIVCTTMTANSYNVRFRRASRTLPCLRNRCVSTRNRTLCGESGRTKSPAAGRTMRRQRRSPPCGLHRTLCRRTLCAARVASPPHWVASGTR